MIDIQIQTDNSLRRARDAFITIAKRVKDLTPVWKRYIEYHTTSLMPGVFNSNGVAMNGKRWEGYRSEKYKKWKRAHGGKLSEILVLDGRLKAATMGGPGFRSTICKQELSMWIEGIPYSRVHQFGYEKQNLAERPYFFTAKGDLPPRAWAFLIQETRNMITDGIK